MTLYIASGECVAEELRKAGKENVFAFNEAMCEGETVSDIESEEFCRLRKKAYGTENYTHFAVRLSEKLKTADRLELFFDYDMFCAVNTITLLAYLEQKEYKGEVIFNLAEQNGTANIVKSFPLTLGSFSSVYKAVLVSRRKAKTGIDHIDKGILLYIDYKKPRNEITEFIEKNISLPREELCKEVIMRFSHYGIGDTSAYRLIDEIFSEASPA